MRRFKGFTLTELMVALAVIGILTAVVTPAIMKTRPNKNKMMIKKTYYTTEHIVSTLINDENLYPDMVDICDDRVDADESNGLYCAYGFDYTDTQKYEGMEYGGDNKFAALFKAHLNVKENIGSADSQTPTGVDFYPKFKTTDGVTWDLSGTKAAWTSKQVSVGTFGSHGAGTAGMGTIKIDVDGENIACTTEDSDCGMYEIQILANGKMRIDPIYSTAADYIEVNTSVRN